MTITQAELDDLWGEDGEPVSLPEPPDVPTIQVAYTELELHLSAIAEEKPS